MSGGGGFYKFRCKYFLSHDCPNWVYVNNTACATCSSKGREIEPGPSQATVMRSTQEIYVPRVEEGVLYYTLMAIEADPGETAGNYPPATYTTTSKETQPPVPTTTSAFPGTPTTTTSF